MCEGQAKLEGVLLGKHPTWNGSKLRFAHSRAIRQLFLRAQTRKRPLRIKIPDRLTPSGMTLLWLKRPFTGFAGIGVYAETPRAGKRQVASLGKCRFPIYGEAVPKGLKGLLGQFVIRPIDHSPHSARFFPSTIARTKFSR
jgi:hypothetical protein